MTGPLLILTFLLFSLVPFGFASAQQAKTLPVFVKGGAETSFDRTLKQVKKQFPFSKAKNQGVAALIQKHLALGLTVPDPKTYRYQKSLGDLKKNAPLIVETIANEYIASAEQSYFSRQLLVLVACELENPAAKPFLKKVIAAKIPPEQSKDQHHFSTVAEEAKIRMIAVNGLEAFGRNGDAAASEELFTLAVSHANRGVRTEGVLGYLALAKNKKEAKARLRTKLKEPDWELIDIVSPPAREVLYSPV